MCMRLKRIIGNMVPFLVENVFKLRVNQRILCVLSLWCCTAESLVFGYWRKLSLMDDGFKIQLCYSLFIFFLMALKVKSVTFAF